MLNKIVNIGRKSKYNYFIRLVILMVEGLRCCICNGETSTGIILLNQYICGNCEAELIHTPTDQLKYEMYKRKIKDIWKQFLIKA